jgi:metal-dependent amidase/aminoacylase/carboxypeptidase family protein
MNKFLKRAQELEASMKNDRHYLHQNAEVGFDLPITTKYVMDRLQEIAKELANNANMPYCWEDIYNRLIGGYPLPFKVEVK